MPRSTWGKVNEHPVGGSVFLEVTKVKREIYKKVEIDLEKNQGGASYAVRKTNSL